MSLKFVLINKYKIENIHNSEKCPVQVSVIIAYHLSPYIYI